ncbi:MAG: hypothetical protein P9M11_05075 [Candidatus Tenebribacter burtonii]|jgi:hypothetical protein|nr:hypothetical protein [Candidatus Tenebribacter burtonii]
MIDKLLTNLFYEYTSIYLFSALLQANAAILAIVGVFGIFRIQSIQTKIDSMKNWVTSTKTGFDPDNMDDFDKKTPEEQKNQISNIHESPLNKILTNILKYNYEISLIKPIIISSSKLLGFGIIIDAIGIICSKTIHNCSSIFELLILVLVLLFHIYLTLTTIKRIRIIIS